MRHVYRKEEFCTLFMQHLNINYLLGAKSPASRVEKEGVV